MLRNVERSTMIGFRTMHDDRGGGAPCRGKTLLCAAEQKAIVALEGDGSHQYSGLAMERLISDQLFFDLDYNYSPFVSWIPGIASFILSPTLARHKIN